VWYPPALEEGLKITLLGTGTSVGVPVIGCACRVCTSDDPRNRRLRQSLWIRNGSASILIDASADFRQQALRYGVRRVDAILLTHPHADHILGLDDTRVFAYWQRQKIPVYGSAHTLDGVRRTFWYAFAQVAEGGGRPKLDLRVLEGPVKVGGLTVDPVEADHGSMPVTAYRIGGFAYLTDCKRVPPEAVRALQGLDTLVINALRHSPPHPTHMTVGEALEAIGVIAPRRALLIHMGHELDHRELADSLPAGVEPAYDGLELEFEEGTREGDVT
jgi:phosphoribosyl 1,2-cyclic phosphate phosphodiesterase